MMIDFFVEIHGSMLRCSQNCHLHQQWSERTTYCKMGNQTWELWDVSLSKCHTTWLPHLKWTPTRSWLNMVVSETSEILWFLKSSGSFVDKNIWDSIDSWTVRELLPATCAISDWSVYQVHGGAGHDVSAPTLSWSFPMQNHSVSLCPEDQPSRCFFLVPAGGI